MPVVISRMNDWHCQNCEQQWCEIRESQVRVAEHYPLGEWINTDDLNDAPDGEQSYYETLYGYEILGKRIASELTKLQCDKE